MTLIDGAKEADQLNNDGPDRSRVTGKQPTCKNINFGTVESEARQLSRD